MKKTTSEKWFQLNYTNDVQKNIKNETKTKPGIKKNIGKENDLKLDLNYPKNVNDLAVHKKKVIEVEEWLKRNAIHNPTKSKVNLLLLTGPSGAGKTATIRTLCGKSHLNIRIIEWITPSIDYADPEQPGQLSRFTEFLTQASRFPSLCTGVKQQEGKVLLVEDFPNVVIHNPNHLLEILEIYMKCGKTPIVFICSDTKSRDKHKTLSQILFPDHIRNTYSIATINFNPVNASLIKTVLKQCCETLSIPQLAPEQYESIENSACGDIRSALNQLKFISISMEKETTPQTRTGVKRKRIKTKQIKQQTNNFCNRDESIDLLHSIGRVLYPKRIESGIEFKHSPQLIVDQFQSSPELFVAFLYENYLRYFGCFNDVCEASEVLSLAELFCADWSMDGISKVYGLWIAVVGLMLANKHVQKIWNPVRGIKYSKTNVKQLSNEESINPVDLFYYNIIKETKNSNL